MALTLSGDSPHIESTTLGFGFGDGTAAAPSITFDADVNTGIFRAGTDELSFTTGGVERVRVESDGAVVFRDAGGTSNVVLNGSSVPMGVNVAGVENASAQNYNIGVNVSYAISDSGVTGGYGSISNFTVPASQAMSLLHNYEARGSAYGAGATCTTAAGFVVSSNLDQGATNVHGFKGSLGTGTGVYNVYIDGSADNYFNGNLLCGYTGALANYRDSQTATIDREPKLQVTGTTSSSASIALTSYNTADSGFYAPHLWLGKSGNASMGSDTIVALNEELGSIVFAGNDGSSFINAACIKGEVDGTPGSEDMPGRLVFETTTDGSNVLSEHMRIDKFGVILMGRTDATVDSSNFGVRLGGSGNEGRLVISRNVGSGGSTVTSFGNAGECRIRGDGDLENTNNRYGALSDIKFKENIVDAGSQWEDIKGLRVRKYNFKEETGWNTHTQIGVVAQELEQLSPGLVSDGIFNEETGETAKSVDYSVLYMKSVKALQEALLRIEDLEQRLNNAGI